MISACYVVHNESELIAESIRSLKAYVDEFIFVDAVFTANPVEATHSTDDTRAIAEMICRPVPVTYIEGAAKMDLGAARNLALSLCRDWAFIVDGDETLLASHADMLELRNELGADHGSVGVTVHTAALLFPGAAPKIDSTAYDVLPVIYTKGVQPRIVQAKGSEWRRTPTGETYGLYHNDILVKVPADPRLCLINHRTRQTYAAYQDDYVWESAL